MEDLSKGWVKIHRKILDWEWYQDVNVFRVFVHCLLMANHEERKYKGKTIPRGSFLSSREILAEQTGLSQRSVRTALNHLKTTNELTIKTTRKGSHIFVCKYSDYQSRESKTTNETTNSASGYRPTGDQQATSNKNEKNYKNEKNTYLNPPEAFQGVVYKKLRKWLSEQDDVKDPDRLATWYFKKFHESSIRKAMNDSTCTSTTQFKKLLNYYEEILHKQQGGN